MNRVIICSGRQKHNKPASAYEMDGTVSAAAAGSLSSTSGRGDLCVCITLSFKLNTSCYLFKGSCIIKGLYRCSFPIYFVLKVLLSQRLRARAVYETPSFPFLSVALQTNIKWIYKVIYETISFFLINIFFMSSPSLFPYQQPANEPPTKPF